MTKNYFRFAASLLALLLVIGANRLSIGEEPEGGERPYRVWVESNFEPDSALRYAVDSDFDSDFYLVQEPAAEAQPTEPALSRSEAVAARRRRSTYRLPSMFGDYFGGGTLALSVLGPPVDIRTTIMDGRPGDPRFFVTNDNGGPGADANFAVPIGVFDRQTGNPIASSVGNGTQVMGANNVTYPISEPDLPGISPPLMPGPGFLVYQGGTATGPIGNGDGWVLDFGHTFTPIAGTIPVPSGGVAVRRFKMSENNSPIPRDRFIANYNFFNDVIGGIGDVNRYAFGFEKTFFGGSSSVQVLFPFASTLDANQVAGGVVAKNTQFGDIPIIFKTILAERDEYVLAGGLGVTVPTGEDAHVFNTSGDEIIHVDHASVHLLPYLGLVRAYDSGWYWQSFLQLDVDTNGNQIRADLTGNNLQHVGVLQEQTLLFADLGLGYIFEELGQNHGLTVAATAELHYVTPLQESDSITAGALDLRNLVNRFDVVNLTLGMNFLTAGNLSIRPAMVIPLSDDQFDYEAMLQANYFR